MQRRKTRSPHSRHLPVSAPSVDNSVRTPVSSSNSPFDSVQNPFESLVVSASDMRIATTSPLKSNSLSTEKLVSHTAGEKDLGSIGSTSPPSFPRLSNVMAKSPVLEASTLGAAYRLKKDKGPVCVEQSQSRHLQHSHSSRRNLYNLDEDFGKETDYSSSEKRYSGPLALAEFERLKKEIETLKKALQESKRTVKKQAKKVDELKAEATTHSFALKDRELELCAYKSKYSKNEETLDAIEAALNCQICMELPHKPHALAPCGHVFCLHCLQEWFRKAPFIDDDEDFDPEFLGSQYALTRTKSCPCCRSVIKRKPAPLFMIKGVALALMKTRPSLYSQPVDLELSDEDPWKGIFADSDEDSDKDEDEEDEEMAVWPYSFDYGYSTSDSDEDDANVDDETDEEDDDDDNDGSQEDPYDEVYVRARWDPPRHTREYALRSVAPRLEHLGEVAADELVKLIQRGCSWEMLTNFDIFYTHDEGISVYLRSLDGLYDLADDGGDGGVVDITYNQVFLGWNIDLDADDVDGEIYMESTLKDIKSNPFRWELAARSGYSAAYDARRLVSLSEVEDYINTDSEA